ncbi:serine/threonine protein kinase SAT4, partial [Ascoidea rubescens DSM 1968]
RFQLFEDGSHIHRLKNTKGQEKVGSLIKDLLGAKKLRDEAVSAIFADENDTEIKNEIKNESKNKKKHNPPLLITGLLNEVRKSGAGVNNINIDNLDNLVTNKIDSRSFVEKYGKCQQVIGKGAFGTVRISHKEIKIGNFKHKNMYAVKEFKRKENELSSSYKQKIACEFSISSLLQHINIIHTLDLLQNAKGDYFEVMEFCNGGDLFSLIITAGKLEYIEADCFFKQLMRGVSYMHDMGVTHRDLKPENLLLTSNGCLKISDFGNGECFRLAWEKEIHLSTGISGSSPYIAPEEFIYEEYDPRPVDIWSCGVIYMAMRTGRQLWKIAKNDDEFYQKYLKGRKDEAGYEPIENIKRARCRNVIYSILDPVPSRRITAKKALNSEWGREIKCCRAAEVPS